MAATVVSRKGYSIGQVQHEEIELSGLTAGATENIGHKGPDGVEVRWVDLKVKTEPTSGDPVFLGQWSTDTTNNELDVVLDTSAAGDLTGAVVVLRLSFLEMAAQDRSSTAQDNNT